MITLLARFIAALNANSRPGEIGAAFACGVLLALIPFGNLLWFGLFIPFFFIKLHSGSLILTIVLFKLFIGLTDPLTDAAGLWILNQPALEPYFTQAVNTPLLPLTGFNNSLVAGGLLIGAGLWIPLFFLGRTAVGYYRTGIRDRIAASKLVKSFEKLPCLRKLSTAVRKSTALYRGWNG
ncbi:MAG: TIGR03546 family protein [Spirochaetota bacterium]